jgi:hypothetical protein
MTATQHRDSQAAQIIESRIVGLYLGWVVPEDGQWQPLMQLTKSDRGYKSSHTCAYQQLAQKYRGMAEIVSTPTVDGNEIAHTIPDIFSVRIPRLRPDTERECKFLGLSYPNIDQIAFLARTGGNIVGDDYDICPIVEPNSYGEYQFYCLLHEIDASLRSKIGTQPQLNYEIASNRQIVIKAAGGNLGLLPPYFSLLGAGITQVEFVKTSDDPYLGNSILVSVTAKTNPYAQRCFELAANEVVV